MMAIFREKGKNWELYEEVDIVLVVKLRKIELRGAYNKYEGKWKILKEKFSYKREDK